MDFGFFSLAGFCFIAGLVTLGAILDGALLAGADLTGVPFVEAALGAAGALAASFFAALAGFPSGVANAACSGDAATPSAGAGAALDAAAAAAAFFFPRPRRVGLGGATGSGG